MKKTIMLVLCIALVVALAIPAFAAGSASYSISPSKSTVEPGEQFTVSIYLDSSAEVQSYGFKFTYDKNVFEMVGGSVTASGAAVSNCSYSAVSGTYAYGCMFTPAKTYTGSYGTATFKVKDSAAPGSYTFGGDPSVPGASPSCNTFTVAICDHSYGNFVKLNATQHQGTCSKCEKVANLNHKWNAGSETKKASCKEDGEMTYTCTDCGETKVEKIDKSTVAHTYGAWTKLSDTQHEHECSVCQKKEQAGHDFDEGEETKKATCKEDGEITYTCGDCKATKTEKIDKATVAHTYGTWTKISDTQHEHECTVCQKKEQGSHTFDAGVETKKPNCKEEGETTYTCSVCKGTKTEPIEKTTTHTYGKWTKISDTQHEHECTVCQKKEQADHAFDAGTVTKKATCKEEGEKTFTCTDCGATQTEKIDKLTTHTFGKWEKVDADKHHRVCTVCEKEEEAAHAYKTAWSKDSKEHWHECADCKDKKDVEKHTPGAAATETTPQTCTVCKYIIQAALGHKHNYATEWTTDETGHWYDCPGCEEKGEFAEHDFENACDPDCSVCGYTRETSHVFTDAWESDSENHWHVCSGCGLKEDEAAHIPGAAATETSAQECTICKYKIAPALGVDDPVLDVPADEAPADDGKTDNSGLMKILFIVLAVAVVGAVVVVIVLGKKKKNS